MEAELDWVSFPCLCRFPITQLLLTYFINTAVMRKEAVYTLLLNVTLFSGMKCTLAQDPRYVRFSVIENGQQTTHYNLRASRSLLA